MSGAATNRRGLGIAAADPSGHRVGGHQSSAAETSRANMRRPDHTTLAKMQKRRAQASQAEALSCFILSRCGPTCLQRGTGCTERPATENPQLLYNLELKKNHNRLIQLGSELVGWRWLQPDTASKGSLRRRAPPHAHTRSKTVPMTPAPAPARAPLPHSRCCELPLKILPTPLAPAPAASTRQPLSCLPPPSPI